MKVVRLKLNHKQKKKNEINNKQVETDSLFTEDYIKEKFK